MRKYKIFEFDGEYDREYILTEEEIRKSYYSYWYQKMCDKFGQETTDNQYTFENCLEDWIITNWAIEVTE